MVLEMLVCLCTGGLGSEPDLFALLSMLLVWRISRRLISRLIGVPCMSDLCVSVLIVMLFFHAKRV